jgi:hypothetical protein
MERLMFALILKADSTLDSIVDSTDGYDLELYDVYELPEGDPGQWAWNGTAIVQRPPTASEETAAALEADPRWQAMKSKTPQEVETWLTSNVTDLASARRVLKILILAVQRLARTR